MIGKKIKEESRILVTLDQDFSDIRASPPEQYSGIVVLRMKRQDKFSIMELFRNIFPAFEVEEINRKLWVVEENRIRIRE